MVAPMRVYQGQNTSVPMIFIQSARVQSSLGSN